MGGGGGGGGGYRTGTSHLNFQNMEGGGGSVVNLVAGDAVMYIGAYLCLMRMA